jgi:tRNA threonylcarbamoyladenosine biosynthesis protein TsaE
MRERFVSRSESETLSIAGAFAKTLLPGTVVALTGELGSGKTVFARGVAGSLGVHEQVTSPTFTLINEYCGEIPLYHMDLYRLNTKREIENIGVDDYFFGNGICLVEWAEKLGDLIPPHAVSVLLRQITPEQREIIIERHE